jgi:hypothetical protein
VTIPVPRVPWQVTGNHWISLPCIHPADAAIHLVGTVNARLRGAVEFAGDAQYLEGSANPLIRIVLEVAGERVTLGSEGIAWERESGWIPTFSARVGSLTVRGTICAPHGRNADAAGAVIALAVENRGDSVAEIRAGLEGTLGRRHVRVRTERTFDDRNIVSAGPAGSVVLEGESAESPMAIAIGGEGDLDAGFMESASSWALGRSFEVGAGQSVESFFHIAAGAERDGALAMLRSMLRRGGGALIDATRAALREMAPSTGNAAADRIVARHAFFCYFASVARALDQSHWYVVRSRLPWNEDGLTIRDWHALMWILPAVQLVDQPLAREILLRVCELHGHAPGSGVSYLDGSTFEPGFSLEGASSYAVAVDAYIVQSSDDKVVEEPVLADALYGSQEDIEARRHPQHPLYSTEVNPDGTVPEQAYTAHGNTVVALALDILRHTLDEKTSEKVQDPAAVRAALMRQFTDGSGGKASMLCSSDLAGSSSAIDSSSASMYWLPYFDLLSRDDSLYRRTVKRIEEGDTDQLVIRCARLVGPSGKDALEWLRRAPLDGGLAAEIVDQDGRAVANGGDAALSGLIAHTVWYAAHALGVHA